MIIDCKICFPRLKGKNLLKGRRYFQKTLYIKLLSKILKSSLTSFFKWLDLTPIILTKQTVTRVQGSK